MLLASRTVDMLETNAGVFHRLGSEGVLSDDTAEEMARAAGLRNVLAHKYGTEIDDEDVFNALQNLAVFLEYLDEVHDVVE